MWWIALALAAEPYWVPRTDLELDALLNETCAASVADRRPVLVAFSASWCLDCKLVRRWSEAGPLADELGRWHTVVVDVGRFDRAGPLREAFGVHSLAHWVALRPTDCDAPVPRWPQLRAGVLEPATGAKTTPEAAAAWLAGARAR